MLELGVNYLKSALGQGATASRALTLETISRSGHSTVSVPAKETAPCVTKFTGQPAKKDRHLEAVNLWLKVKLTLWLKQRSLSRGGLVPKRLLSALIIVCLGLVSPRSHKGTKLKWL